MGRKRGPGDPRFLFGLNQVSFTLDAYAKPHQRSRAVLSKYFARRGSCAGTRARRRSAWRTGDDEQSASLSRRFPTCSRAPRARGIMLRIIESIWRCSSSSTAPPCDEGVALHRRCSRHRQRHLQSHQPSCSGGCRFNARAATEDPALGIQTLEFCTPCCFIGVR